MVELRHVTTRLSGPAGFLAGLSDSLLLEGPAGLRYYTVNGRGGGVLALDPEKRLSPARLPGWMRRARSSRGCGTRPRR